MPKAKKKKKHIGERGRIRADVVQRTEEWKITSDRTQKRNLITSLSKPLMKEALDLIRKWNCPDLIDGKKRCETLRRSDNVRIDLQDTYKKKKSGVRHANIQVQLIESRHGSTTVSAAQIPCDVNCGGQLIKDALERGLNTGFMMFIRKRPIGPAGSVRSFSDSSDSISQSD